ncbi:MAG TPA: MFS transporter [Phycisphaerales bacterium]|nr:MFS transporter [Phycisphaerales bacterium]HMP37746.1 MFS transporter [Phycisphaerales bacterium]
MSHGAPAAIGLRLSVMMFLQFFIWGAWYVTTNNYMSAHGLSSVIAWAYTVGPIAAIVSPFFLGMVADRFFASERILSALHIAGGVFIMLAPTMAKYQWGWAPTEGPLAFLREGPFLGILLLHMLCYMPTLALTNTVAFHSMHKPEKQFPLVRVWGTIGWIVAGLLISRLGVDRADSFILGDPDSGGFHLALGQYHLAGLAGLLLGVYSLSLPHTPPPLRGKAFRARDALGLDALSMLRSRSFAVFIICSFLLCIPLAAYYAFTNGFIEDRGVTAVGAAMSRGQMSEILFMLVMPACFAVLGVKWMLAVGMLAWVVRYLLFAWGAELPTAEHGAFMTFLTGDAAMLLPIFIGILLHGICYDFFFVTGFIYVDREAPAAIRASAQGFLVLVTQGLGMLIGAQVAGALHSGLVATDDPSWRTFWLVPAIFALVILIFFVVLFRAPRRPQNA